MQSSICGIGIILKAMAADKMEPQINADERRLNASSEEILGAYFEISDFLVVGFLEDVYKNALKIILIWRELKTFQLAQCLNCLRITGLKLYLFLNFYKQGLEIKRIINGI